MKYVQYQLRLGQMNWKQYAVCKKVVLTHNLIKNNGILIIVKKSFLNEIRLLKEVYYAY